MQFGGQFERRKQAPAQLSLWQASSLDRPEAGPCLDLNPSNPFQKLLEVQWKLAFWLSNAVWGQFERRKPAPAMQFEV